MEFTRRDRFILGAALSFGVGNLLVPKFFTELFNGISNPNSGLQGVFNSITIILSTPCMWTTEKHLTQYWDFVFFLVLAAGIVAVILNLILPQEINVEEIANSEEFDLEDQKEGASVLEVV